MSVHLPEGTLFAGRYRLSRCIAAGGMGAVYEAVHVETDRRRALKVMHAHLFQSDEMRERFKREARIAAQVESEHIVDVSDAGVDDATGMPFLVMELLRGEDLHERLKRLGPRPPAEVVTHLRQAALALDKTHAAGIVHRDLKPQNLFLIHREDGTPRIKILDFGIAKVVRDGATAAGATQSLGTPIYMAPEQFRVAGKLTPATDMYALGMLAFTLLVGRAYWSLEAQAAQDVLALVLVAVGGPQEPATQRAATYGVTLPPTFDAWFSRVTAPEPTHRFKSATEAVQGLAEALGAPGTGTGEPAPGESAPPPRLVTPEVPATPPPTSTTEGPTLRYVPGREAPTTATSAAVTIAQTKPRWQRTPSVIAAVSLAALAGLGLLGLRAPGTGALGATASSTANMAAATATPTAPSPAASSTESATPEPTTPEPTTPEPATPVMSAPSAATGSTGTAMTAAAPGSPASVAVRLQPPGPPARTQDKPRSALATSTPAATAPATTAPAPAAPSPTAAPLIGRE